MKKVLIAATALVLISTAFVYAGPRMGMNRGFGPGSCNIEGLNLTAEQSEKVVALKQKHAAQAMENRNKMFQKRAEMRLEWMQTNPNVDKIKSLQAQINELRSANDSMMVDQEIEFRSILTPEQLTRYLAQGMGRGRSFGRAGRAGAMAQGAGRGMMGQGLNQANCPNAPAQQ